MVKKGKLLYICCHYILWYSRMPRLKLFSKKIFFYSWKITIQYNDDFKIQRFQKFQNQPDQYKKNIHVCVHPCKLCLAKIEDFFESLQNFTKRCDRYCRIFWCNMQGRVIYLRFLRAIVRREVFHMKISVFNSIESSECSM